MWPNKGIDPVRRKRLTDVGCCPIWLAVCAETISLVAGRRGRLFVRVRVRVRVRDRRWVYYTAGEKTCCVGSSRGRCPLIPDKKKASCDSYIAELGVADRGGPRRGDSEKKPLGCEAEQTGCIFSNMQFAPKRATARGAGDA